MRGILSQHNIDMQLLVAMKTRCYLVRCSMMRRYPSAVRILSLRRVGGWGAPGGVLEGAVRILVVARGLVADGLGGGVRFFTGVGGGLFFLETLDLNHFLIARTITHSPYWGTVCRFLE